MSSMALRNRMLLGNCTAASAFGDCSSFFSGKTSGTSAQRLAIRGPVILCTNLEWISASVTDLFVESTSGRAGDGGVKLQNRSEAAEISTKLSAHGEVVRTPSVLHKS